MAWLLLVGASLAWVGFDICRKGLVKNYSPLIVTFGFSLLTLPIYTIIYLNNNDISYYQIDRLYYVVATLSGLLATVGAVSFITALSRGRFSILIPVLALTPVVSALFNYFIFSVVLPWYAYIFIFISCYATYRLLGKGFAITEKGAGFMLLAAFSWGACISIDQFVLQFAPVSFHALWINIVVCFILIIVVLVTKPAFQAVNNISRWLIGVTCFSLAVFLQFSALKYIDASIVEAVKRAIGVISALFVGRILFKEHLTPAHYFFSCLIIVAVTSLGITTK